MKKEIIDRHHLLEIILWPNKDGTFRTILNSAERLKELGIYADYKMTIPLTRSEHCRLHMKDRIVNNETRNKMSKSKKGKTLKPFSDEHKQHIRVSRIGQTHSDETKKKVSDSVRAYWARRKAANK